MWARLFPFVRTFREYRREFLPADLIAGLTVAVILVPQSMAYAMLAGLPPVHGLYAAALAPAIGALWGSSPQLATGPVAIVSLLVFTSLTPFVQPESSAYVALAAKVALIVALIQMALGAFRMGFLMNFVSHSVIVGFTNAGAIIIAVTQVRHLLGIEVAQYEVVLLNLWEIARHIPETNLYTVGIAFVALAILLLKNVIPRNLPFGLMAVVSTALSLYVLDGGRLGVKIVGEIPRGLPAPTFPAIDFHALNALVGGSVVIALIGFMEAYAIAKGISLKTKRKLDTDQELIGQGLANFSCALLRGYPVSGSFSRTAVNFSVGAKTPVASVVTSALVVGTVYTLAPLISYIPRAALAAIVIMAVLGLVKVRAFAELFRTNKPDGYVALATFALAFLMKVDHALLIGIALSMILFLGRSMRPRLVVVSRDPAIRLFRNVKTTNLPSCPQILFVRPDTSIYFANAEKIAEHLVRLLRGERRALKFFVIDLEAVNYLDATGVEELREVFAEGRKLHIEVALAHVKAPVKAVLEGSGLLEAVGEQTLKPSKGKAISQLVPLIDHQYCREVCPHAVFDECWAVKQQGEKSHEA